MTGAIVFPQMPTVDSVWALREILPQTGESVQVEVKRVWRDESGRLLARFEGNDGYRFTAEVWVRPRENAQEKAR